MDRNCRLSAIDGLKMREERLQRHENVWQINNTYENCQCVNCDEYLADCDGDAHVNYAIDANYTVSM